MATATADGSQQNGFHADEAVVNHVARKRSRTGTTAGCLTLFAIPFAGVSVVMGALLAMTLVEWARMQSWVETPARITKAEMNEQHDDSTTYQVLAQYEYQFNGKAYQGSRVGLHGGNDNIGTYQQRVHQELRGYQTSGEPFRCYVNPNNPSEAILYRELRAEIIAFFDLFIIVFGAVGWGLLIGSICVARDARARASLAAANPDQPWLWQRDWAANEIQPLGKSWSQGLLFIAVFWNMATAPLWWLLPQEVWKGELWALLPMALPAIGLGLAIAAIRSVTRWRSGHGCRFRMKTVPGSIGGTLEGRIETDWQLDSEEVSVRLSCEKKVENDDAEKWVEQWNEERLISTECGAMIGNDGTVIPVLFEIPGSCRPTEDETIRWKLTAASPSVVRRFKLEFPVPIFDANQTARALPT